MFLPLFSTFLIVYIMIYSLGAKGMFMLKMNKVNQDDPPKVWVRDSQLKVKLSKDPPESKLILDLV